MFLNFNSPKTGLYNKISINGLENFHSLTTLDTPNAYIKNKRKLFTKQFRKNNFPVIFNTTLSAVFINKSVKTTKITRKYYKILYNFFKKFPYNKITGQKSAKFLSYLIMYFLTTHDLYFFVKKLTIFLQNTPRRFQFKMIRFFTLLNQAYFKGLFSFFRINGLYFRISGKFSGIGGSKKLKKRIVWLRPKFSSRNSKIQRSTQFVWSFTGTTTWSVYASYKICLILI